METHCVFDCINFDILGVILQDISIVEKWVSDPWIYNSYLSQNKK